MEKQYENHKLYIIAKDGCFVKNVKTNSYRIIIKDNYLYVIEAWAKGYEKKLGKIVFETDDENEAKETMVKLSRKATEEMVEENEKIINKKQAEFKDLFNDFYKQIVKPIVAESYEEATKRFEKEFGPEIPLEQFIRVNEEVNKEIMERLEKSKPISKGERMLEDWQQRMLEEYEELKKELETESERYLKGRKYLLQHTKDGELSHLEWYLLDTHMKVKSKKLDALSEEIKILGYRLDQYGIEH